MRQGSRTGGDRVIEEENARDAEDFARAMSFVHQHARGDVEGVHGPGSLVWKVGREPGILFGGVAAVLLQVAHPAIADGVFAHSSFYKDLPGRARRTFTSMYELLFGTTPQACAASRRLFQIHTRVRGTIEQPGSSLHGARYRANEQHLLLWVASTLFVTVAQAYDAIIEPMDRAQRERHYREWRVTAAQVGVTPDTTPPDLAAFERWYEAEVEGASLHVGDKGRHIVGSIFGSPYSQPPDRILTTGFLPPRLRAAYDLPWGWAEKRAFEAMTSTLRASARVVGKPYRFVVAYHQANERIARARGLAPSLLERAVGVAGRRVALPTGIKAIAAQAG